MKQKVRLDTFSIMLSGIVLIILLCTLHFTNSVFIISIITAVVIIWGSLALYYMPLSISVENGDLCVNCPFRTKRISLEEINYIERHKCLTDVFSVVMDGLATGVATKEEP